MLDLTKWYAVHRKSGAVIAQGANVSECSANALLTGIWDMRENTLAPYMLMENAHCTAHLENDSRLFIWKNRARIAMRYRRRQLTGMPATKEYTCLVGKVFTENDWHFLDLIEHQGRDVLAVRASLRRGGGKVNVKSWFALLDKCGLLQPRQYSRYRLNRYLK